MDDQMLNILFPESYNDVISNDENLTIKEGLY
jgi:hypothetical protein